MQTIHPVTGWALNHIAALDAHAPGMAGHFLRSSDERRQVIAAHLAMQPLPEESLDRTQLAEFLRHGSHKQILECAFPKVPQGLRGALRRSGPQPHPRPYYRMLFHLLSSDADARVGAVIRRLDAIDLLRIRIARVLPPDLCTANLVSIVGSVRTATDVTKLADLLSRNGIDRPALAEAVRRVSSESQLRSLWARWSQKLALPPHPVAGSEHYKPVQSGEELRQLALRFRNCARRYLSEVMQGEAAFAEFVHAGKRGVIHLSREGEKWKLEGIFAKDNAMVSPELRFTATTYLAEQGVETGGRRRPDGEWAVLRRLSAPHFFEF